MSDLIERLGFWIDRSGATAVLREVGGGCHPATRIELALWDALEAALVDAERYRWLRDPCSGAERVIFYCRGDYGRGLMSSATLDAAIDQARGKGVAGG